MSALALVVWLLGGSLAGILDKKATATMSWQAVAIVGDLLIVATLPLYAWAFRDKLTSASFTAPGVAWSLAAGLLGHLCYLCWFVALRRWEASQMAAYGLLDVAVSVLLCRVVLSEPITAAKACGVGLMLAGAWVLGR